MTPAGRATIVLGLLIALLGYLVGYTALTGMGLSLLTAAALAAVLAGRETDLGVTRSVTPDRVTAGEEATSTLTITNEGRRPFSATIARERVGDATIRVPIPSLEAGESVTIRLDLPTDRRGVFDVGPLTVPRADPIGLARRGSVESSIDRLIVHPSFHLATPAPARRRRDLEGAHSGEAAAGGITFANLREYAPGDDVRLVHWKSSARTDQLMVRHTVDIHRPRTSVVLDTSAEVYSEDAFEDAVRAAASLTVAAIGRRFPYVLRTTSGDVLRDPSTQLAVLDRLAALDVTDDPIQTLGGATLELTRSGGSGLSCTVITGRAGVEALEALGPLRTRFDQLTIVRMGAGQGAQIHELSGATLINAESSEQFTLAWNRRMGK